MKPETTPESRKKRFGAALSCFAAGSGLCAAGLLGAAVSPALLAAGATALAGGAVISIDSVLRHPDAIQSLRQIDTHRKPEQ